MQKSKFDVRTHGFWAEVINTIKFSGYVLLTFIAWVFYGGLVRRAYKKATQAGDTYYLDKMPSGKKPE